MARKIERCCKIKNNNLSFWVDELMSWCVFELMSLWVDGLMSLWVDGLMSWRICELLGFRGLCNLLVGLFLHVVHDKECLCGVGIATATSPSLFLGALNPDRALGCLSKEWVVCIVSCFSLFACSAFCLCRFRSLIWLGGQAPTIALIVCWLLAAQTMLKSQKRHKWTMRLRAKSKTSGKRRGSWSGI